MKNIRRSIFALFVALPLYGQGLTLTLRESGPAGQTTPMLQADRSHARLDIPSLVSQVLYDPATKTLQVLVPLLRTYREYTPAIVQERAAAARGQAPVAPALAPITYKRTGTNKVRDWSCTTYDGFRGADKVVEMCVAEGSAIALSAADFVIVQQAIDMMKTITPPEMIERIPVYGTVAGQGSAGFPVRRVSFRNGQPDITTELVEIRRDAIPASNFAVPAGFNKAQ
jgi:hypothetical protein